MRETRATLPVMAGLDPAIHDVFVGCREIGKST